MLHALEALEATCHALVSCSCPERLFSQCCDMLSFSRLSCTTCLRYCYMPCFTLTALAGHAFFFLVKRSICLRYCCTCLRYCYVPCFTLSTMTRTCRFLLVVVKRCTRMEYCCPCLRCAALFACVAALLLYCFTALLLYLYAAGALEGAHTARLVRNPHMYRQPAPPRPTEENKSFGRKLIVALTKNSRTAVCLELP